MKIAIIKNQKCINVALFDDLKTAQDFLTQGVWEADSVTELPEGFGIGDFYDGEWTKAPQPEPEPPLPPAPDPTDILNAIIKGATNG